MNRMNLRRVAYAVALCAATSAQADSVGPLGTIAAPVSLAFSSSTAASTLTLHTGTPLASPYNFLDAWTFTLGTSSNVTSLVAAFNFGGGGPGTFGIDNLQVNLLDSLNNVVVSGWQTVTNNSAFSSIVSVTPSTGLAAGSYSLQVRGTLLADPASYAGTLIAATPATVPLPAALPLLLAGVGVLGAVGGRRRTTRGAV